MPNRLYSICKHAIPHLRQTKGRIINVSSGAATGHYASWGAYGSSKAAMNHFTATLAVEEPDITSVAVRPGVSLFRCLSECSDQGVGRSDGHAS